MKNFAIVVTFILISFSCYSQGIKFEQGKWNEILELANKSNKPVFVDIYTSWCGPCKKMSTEVFPLESVGKIYNANYVCYQIDAEKGEGLEIAKKYLVTAYPTYLFIKADGTLFSRASGSMESSKFIEISKMALIDQNDPKPIVEWDAEYPSKKNNPQFILDYMNKRSRLELPNISLFNEYLQLIPESERTSEQVLKIYLNDGIQLKINDFAYQNLLKYRNEYMPKLFGDVSFILVAGVCNTVKEASQSKNEDLLKSAISIFDQIPTDTRLKTKEEIYMDYYKRTKEVDKYLKHTTLFCNNNLMKVSLDTILKRDSSMLQVFNQQVASGVFSQYDSTQLELLKKSMSHLVRDGISTGLNNHAWYVFENISDSKSLQEALNWSDRSLLLDPNNGLWMDTNANLLYKLGRKEEAIKQEKKAIELYSKDGKKSTKGFIDTLKKMESGEKSW